MSIEGASFGLAISALLMLIGLFSTGLAEWVETTFQTVAVLGLWYFGGAWGRAVRGGE